MALRSTKCSVHCRIKPPNLNHSLTWQAFPIPSPLPGALGQICRAASSGLSLPLPEVAALWLAKHLQTKAPASLGVQPAAPDSAESLPSLIFHLRCFQSTPTFLSSAIHHKNGAAELKGFMNESLGRCIPLPRAHKSGAAIS